MRQNLHGWRFPPPIAMAVVHTPATPDRHSAASVARPAAAVAVMPASRLAALAAPAGTLSVSADSLEPHTPVESIEGHKVRGDPFGR